LTALPHDVPQNASSSSGLRTPLLKKLLAEAGLDKTLLHFSNINNGNREPSPSSHDHA
jgi:hypothetical protein